MNLIARLALLLLLLCILPTASCSGEDGAPAPMLDYRIVARLPHDPGAFTQGLAYADGVLWEGTGKRGRSSLRRVDPDSGEVLDSVALDDRYFGEGIALVADRVIQLTWTSRTGLVYDRASLEPIGSFEYDGQGWGLCHDPGEDRLVMSDGSAWLRFLDPNSFRELGRVQVTDAGRPIPRINELEVVGGELFANVWPTDRVARIDLASGRVTGWLDFTRLRIEVGGRTDVLNGIAHDPESGRFFLTGKEWPTMFQVELARDN